MVLTDTLTRWSHVSLFSNHGVAFDRFLPQIIRLKAQFPDFPITKFDLITPMNLHQFPNFYIKKLNLIMPVNLHLKSFNDCCMSSRVDVEHSIAHTHTQNGLAEFFTKRLQLIAKQLILRSDCLFLVWGMQYYMLHH